MPAAAWPISAPAATGLLADSRLLWFVNRGSGVVLLALLTMSLLLGVLATARTRSRLFPRFLTQAVHRNVALFSVGMVLVHAGAAAVDGFVDISWPDVVVPFGAGYRPFWTGLGTLSFDLLLVTVVTSLARRRLGHRGWRILHLATYACWLIGLAHGLGIGSDRQEPWSVTVSVLSIGLVAGAGAFRLGSVALERRLAA